MKRLFITLLVMILIIQALPVIQAAMALSKADFAPKRRTLCEIFVEPN